MLGLIERSERRRIILIPIENRKSETLTLLIRKYVHPESIIYTDGWRGYLNISKFFIHYIVNHSLNFKDPDTGVHINTIEGNWAPLKKEIPRRWRTKSKIHFSLVIFMMKRNRSILDFIKIII